MVKKDFDVLVVDKDKKMKFTGNNCTVKKTLKQRLGLSKKVEETIECDYFSLK